MNTISWASPTTPLPMETNPRVVFERLFGGPGTAEQRQARGAHANRSILDSVMAKAKDLAAGAGRQDQTRLADYLDNIREIERRIEQAETQSAGDVHVPAAPMGVPGDRAEHVALLFDLPRGGVAGRSHARVRRS